MQGTAAPTSTAYFLRRKKRADERGVFLSAFCSGGKRKSALVLHSADDCGYGNPHFRAAVYHGGSFKSGASGSELQGKAARDFPHKETVPDTSAVLPSAGNSQRFCLRDKERKACEPVEYLGRNEKAVRECGRGRGKGFSAQSSSSLREDLLPHGKGYCKAGRSVRTHEYRDDTHLSHGKRKGAREADRAAWTCDIDEAARIRCRAGNFSDTTKL